MKTVNVIGLGLAGVEATYQLAKRGILVDAYEMKPTKFSPAHESENFAEICVFGYLAGNGIEFGVNGFVYNVNYSILHLIVGIDYGCAVVQHYVKTLIDNLITHHQCSVIEIPFA